MGKYLARDHVVQTGHSEILYMEKDIYEVNIFQSSTAYRLIALLLNVFLWHMLQSVLTDLV